MPIAVNVRMQRRGIEKDHLIAKTHQSKSHLFQKKHKNFTKITHFTNKTQIFPSPEALPWGNAPENPPEAGRSRSHTESPALHSPR